MSFRLVPKSVTLNDLERRNGLILRYFNKLGSFRGALRNSAIVVGKSLTMDSLRLLYLVVYVCRWTARRPQYKYSITARWKFGSRFTNSRLNAQYLHSYRLIC